LSGSNNHGPTPWSGGPLSGRPSGPTSAGQRTWSDDILPPGGAEAGNGGGAQAAASPDVQLLMNQVSQLQQKVMQMSQSGHGGNAGDQFYQQPNEQRILLVSNLPSTLATCDSVYFMFERFGIVERVKILHNKRSTALVQMQSPEMAENAVQEQHVLNRTGYDIYVNFSNKVSEVRLPYSAGMGDDGLSKDFTQPMMQQQHNHQHRNHHNQQQHQGSYYQQDDNQGPQGQSGQGGLCLLVSSLPDDLANPESICNLFGYYGDVHRVKILRNKKDCALIQMAKPHQVAMCRQHLDQVKVSGKTLCVSFSRCPVIKLPTDIGIDDDNSTKDFTNVKGVHRFRNPNVAQKLAKNLCAPTALLHVANLPEKYSQDDLKTYFTEQGFTIKDIQEVGKDGNMALVQMSTVDEAINALAKLHNVTPEGHTTKNNSGLCFSFSSHKIQKSDD
jgi:RNA recognition motif-containing protein